MNDVFLKLKSRRRRPINLKERKSRVKSGSTKYKSNHASLSFVSDSRRGADAQGGGGGGGL